MIKFLRGMFVALAVVVSTGLIVVFAGIVMTVAVFPSARDGLVQIVHAFNQGDQ